MKCLVVLLVVAALFATGEAIRCYFCWENAECNDPFNITARVVLVTNHTGDDVCMKAVTTEGKNKITRRYSAKLPGPRTNNTRVHEMDSRVVVGSGASRADDNEGTITTLTHYCSTDLCNGAGSFTAELVVLAVPLVFMIWH